MNLLQAYSLLDKLTEGKLDYLDDYKKYLLDHKAKVKEFADWLVDNLPELFNDVDLEAFYKIIEEHDGSKLSEEEFEHYAKKWFSGEETPEYEEARQHHWMNNEHHPEFWQGEDVPYIYILEMICDWFVDSGGSVEKLIDFYNTEIRDDKEKNLSDATKEIIEEILDKLALVMDKKEE